MARIAGQAIRKPQYKVADRYGLTVIRANRDRARIFDLE